MIAKVITVGLTNTIEVRPLAMVVQLAGKYDSQIRLSKDDRTINAKSFMGVIALGLDQGDSVLIEAEGADEVEALNEIVRFLENR